MLRLTPAHRRLQNSITTRWRACHGHELTTLERMRWRHLHHCPSDRISSEARLRELLLHHQHLMLLLRWRVHVATEHELMRLLGEHGCDGPLASKPRRQARKPITVVGLRHTT